MLLIARLCSIRAGLILAGLPLAALPLWSLGAQGQPAHKSTQLPDNACLMTFGVGPKQRLNFDFGFVSSQWGATRTGFHLGLVGVVIDDENNNTGQRKSPGDHEEILGGGGFQIGGFADVGRAWCVGGVEHFHLEVRHYTLAADYTMQSDTGKQEEGGLGVYFKAGYRLGTSWSVWAGGGSRSGFVAGVGLHF